jgi:hypothetical protein
MYDDLKNLISGNQLGFRKIEDRSMVTNFLEYVSFVLNSIEERWQVDSVYTDFSKDFDRVCHQLLLEEMSVGTLSRFMAKFLFDRENSKDKKRRRCLLRISSRTIVFHLVCQQNIGDIKPLK